eukprot:355236-Chlamydomonas_euryale.AAC.4
MNPRLYVLHFDRRPPCCTSQVHERMTKQQVDSDASSILAFLPATGDKRACIFGVAGLWGHHMLHHRYPPSSATLT